MLLTVSAVQALLQRAAMPVDDPRRVDALPWPWSSLKHAEKVGQFWVATDHPKLNDQVLARATIEHCVCWVRRDGHRCQEVTLSHNGFTIVVRYGEPW